MSKVKYDEYVGSDAEDMPHFCMENNKVIAYHYPFCCTGVVLTSLGGSKSAFDDRHRFADELPKDLLRWIEYFGRNNSKQFISVCTTREQEDANRVLRVLGFTKSRWLTNTKYKNSDLCTWTFSLHQKIITVEEAVKELQSVD